MTKMTGGKFIADTVHGYGISHVFFMPYIAPRALMEMEKLGIRRIQTHGEKAAAYMADAYARVKRGPGLCMAQSVGAVNLAAVPVIGWLLASGFASVWCAWAAVTSVLVASHLRRTNLSGTKQPPIGSDTVAA